MSSTFGDAAAQPAAKEQMTELRTTNGGRVDFTTRIVPKRESGASLAQRYSRSLKKSRGAPVLGRINSRHVQITGFFHPSDSSTLAAAGDGRTPFALRTGEFAAY